MEQQEYRQMYKLENTHWWFLAKRRFIAAVFPKKKNLKILDIGAGTGGTTQFLKQYGEVTGVEENELAYKLAKKRKLEILKAGAEKLPFGKEKFDVVCFFDVLYHQNIKSDLEALKEASRVLKPQGFLVITDCAFEFLKGPHDEAVHARERYTRGKLVKNLQQAGFTVEKASYVFFFLFPLATGKRLLAKFKTKLLAGRKAPSEVDKVPKLVNWLFFSLCAFEAALLPFMNFPWGSSIIIRARKEK